MTDSSGYSAIPLVRKLGLKSGMTVRLLDPPAGYWELLGGTPESLGVSVAGPETGEVAFTHLFADEAEGLERHVRYARDAMAEDGMVWISWPKKSSGRDSEIGRAEVMAAGHAAGLVDVKVCAVDETWSGLRFVVPLEDRAE